MTTSSLHGILPLTVAQRGLWMAQFIAPAGSTFNVAEAVELPGRIDEGIFFRALRHVHVEAEALRARVVQTPEGPQQEILDGIQPVFPLVDLSASSYPRDDAQFWMLKRLRAPINMQTDQLWQNALIKLGRDHYIWFHCCHHVMLDGYSGGMIASRVAAVYSQLSQGNDPDPSPFLPLSTLVDEERAYRASNRYEVDRAYWREHLNDSPEPASLSLRPHKPTSGECGGVTSRCINLAPEIVSELNDLGRRYGATVPQTLTALLVSYLFRVTDETDLVVGMPVSARIGQKLRRTPGTVANIVALRFAYAEDTSLGDLIVQARREMRGALRHQQFRYEDLRRDLGLFEVNRQISRIGINIEPFDYKLSFDGVIARNHNLCNGAMEDLTIFVFDRQDGQGISIQCDANPALYTTQELDTHLLRIKALIPQLMGAPDAPILGHDILLDADRRRQNAFVAASTRHWPNGDLNTLLERTFQSHAAHDVAVIDDSGAMPYASLAHDVDSLAASLAAMGIGPGHLIALALPRDRRMVLALAAIARIGAAWLPLDINGPQSRAQAVLDDGRPALVVTDEAHQGWAHDRAVFVLPLNGKPTRLAGVVDTTAGGVPPGTAYVTYTSGTTGRPKGVVVPHSALYNFLLSMRECLNFRSQDRLLSVTTPTFDISLLEFLLPLVCGGSLVIAPYEAVHNPRHLTALMRDHRVTVVQATPTLWQALLTVEDGESLRGLSLLSGGEALPPHLARRLFALGRRVFNLYGPTETTIWSTIRPLEAEDLDAPPVGKPIANTQIFIVDRYGNPRPDGVIGELMIGGDGVASGYLNRPDLTRTQFVAAPTGCSSPFAYKTGDRAARDSNGLIHLFGRADDQIKIRGMRIEPAEIEAALLALDSVAQAAVIVDKADDTNKTILTAYLVPAIRDDIPDAADLRQTLTAHLPPQMLPHRFVWVEALTRSASGKLDRTSLKALVTHTEAAEVVLARTPAERMLSDIWASLLEVDEVDVHANFFDLGGDSLLALQMITALAERGYDLPVGHIFSVPTVAALAPYFENGAKASDPLAVVLPLRASGSHPPLFCIHPVLGLGWNFSRLAACLPDEYPVYALQDVSLTLGDTPVENMEALIEVYLREIRAIQPFGPYTLVGWSMGGAIAYGLAARLREQGESIATLALLDSYLFHEDTANLSNDPAAAARAAMDFLHMAPQAGQPVPVSLDGVADMILGAIDLSSLPISLGGQADRMMDLSSALRRVTLHNIDLLQRYRPQQTDQDMLFIRATLRSGSAANALIADSSEIWQQHTTGTIMVHDLPCSHQDMLQPGTVQQVGRILEDYMAAFPGREAERRDDATGVTVKAAATGS